MGSLISNKTYKLDELPQDCKTKGCKWLFRKKIKSKGKIEKFKARLAPKGFKQKVHFFFFFNFFFLWLLE
jgi:hypothetical protein